MKRLLQAPNLALATLWADQLAAAGVPATVLRAYANSIAGEIPPDQALPEVWVQHDDDLPRARALLDEWRHTPEQRWSCPGCDEIVEGPFEQCWSCGRLRPGPADGPVHE